MKIKSILFLSLSLIFLFPIVALSSKGHSETNQPINQSTNQPIQQEIQEIETINFFPTISNTYNTSSIDRRPISSDTEKNSIEVVYYISAEQAYSSGMTSINPTNLPTYYEFLDFNSTSWETNVQPVKDMLNDISSNFEIIYSSSFEGTNTLGEYYKVEKTNRTSTFSLPFVTTDEEWYFIGTLEVLNDDEYPEIFNNRNVWYEDVNSVPKININLIDMSYTTNGIKKTIPYANWQLAVLDSMSEEFFWKFSAFFLSMSLSPRFTNDSGQTVNLRFYYTNKYYWELILRTTQEGTNIEFTNNYSLTTSNENIEVVNYVDVRTPETIPPIDVPEIEDEILNLNWLWWTLGGVGAVILIGTLVWFYINQKKIDNKKNQKNKDQ